MSDIHVIQEREREKERLPKNYYQLFKFVHRDEIGLYVLSIPIVIFRKHAFEYLIVCCEFNIAGRIWRNKMF